MAARRAAASSTTPLRRRRIAAAREPTGDLSGAGLHRARRAALAARGARRDLRPDARHRTGGDLVRAALEAVCYQTRDLLDAFGADSGMKPDRDARRWRHGAERLDAAIPRRHARSAGRAAGAQRGDGARRRAPRRRRRRTMRVARGDFGGGWQLDRRFTPAMPADRRDALYAGWRRAVEAVKLYAVARNVARCAAGPATARSLLARFRGRRFMGVYSVRDVVGEGERRGQARRIRCRRD